MESGEQERLMESRRTLKREVRAALRCRTKKQKWGIVERWKRELNPIMVGTLMRVMKEREVAKRIADWPY